MLEVISSHTISSDSDAALATLHTGNLSSDLLVSLVVLVSSPLQLQLNLQSSSSTGRLEAKNGSWNLTQRNAIVRWVVGLGLHNAVDRATGLLGGYNDSAKASPSAAVAIAEISSWMATADSLRMATRDSAELHHWAQKVDSFLSRRAFLVPTAKPTVADFDVAFAFLEHFHGDTETWRTHLSKYIHLQRWIDQCLATAMELVLLHYKAPLNYRNQYTDRENIYSTFTDTIRRFRGEPAKSMYTPIFGFPKNMTQHAASSLENPAYPSNENGSDGSKSRVSHVPSSPKQVDGTKDKKKRGNHSTIVPKDLTQQQNVDPITPSQSNNVANPKPSFVDSTADAIKERNDSDLFNISSLDIRVGQIVRVWPHESADKLFCEEILVGEDQPRLIASGLRPFYSLEEMQNQRVLVLANLKARNLVGFASHGMVLCASNQDHTQVEFVVPPNDAKIGERVMFDGYNGQPEPENKVAKKKILESVLPHLMTNDDGVVTWKGAISFTTAGPCVSSKGMKNAKVA